MKHDCIVLPDGRINFQNADQMVRWAKDCGVQVFGHTLGWHSQQQRDWLDPLIAGAPDEAAAAERVRQAHKDWVDAMVAHFDVYAWDVVNEALADSGEWRSTSNTQDGYHIFLWGTYYPGGTKEFADAAFRAAREALDRAGKTADLYINDYNLETDRSKRRALCNYAKSNPNVTGVASQMHLDINIPDLKGKVKESLTDLVATGKMVRISELDIKNNNEEAQADMIKYIFEQYLAIVPAAQRGGITFWGINDKDSWLGENNHPLLWKGSGYEKKKVYETLYLYLCELNGLSPNKE